MLVLALLSEIIHMFVVYAELGGYQITHMFARMYSKGKRLQ